MAEVVSNLSSVNESDVRAIATYMAGVFGAPTPDRIKQGEAVLAQAQNSGDRNAAVAADQRDRRGDLCGGLRDLP